MNDQCLRRLDSLNWCKCYCHDEDCTVEKSRLLFSCRKVMNCIRSDVSLNCLVVEPTLLCQNYLADLAQIDKIYFVEL